jgi:hypothetical protein
MDAIAVYSRGTLTGKTTSIQRGAVANEMQSARVDSGGNARRFDFAQRF